MDFSISALLSTFADDKLVAPKALEKKLECESPESLQQLEIALNALERIGILVKERGKYRRISEEGVVEGKLRCSSKGFCFAIQEGEEAEDIYIRESQLNTAWNGDRVLVKVTKEGRRRRSPEGEVRLILERSNPSVIAHVRQNEQGRYAAIPLDDRLLFELELMQQEDGPRLEEAVDHLVHAQVVRYPLGQQPPLGRVNQILGSDAQSAADTELVFCKYDLPRDFPVAVEAEAQALPIKLRKADQNKRVAYQKWLTVAVGDGSVGLASLDHAVSCDRNKDGTWRLGVHIADVQRAVPSHSALDQEAKLRGTTIGLSDTLVPLFPAAIAERVGAFAAQKETLAISVVIDIDAAGNLISYVVHPSVVQADYQISYEQLQAVIGRAEGLQPDADISQLKKLHTWADKFYELSQLLEKQRRDRGDFDLVTLPEVHPRIFGDDGRFGVLADAAPATGRQIVAEVLVLANYLLTAHLRALGVPVLYQVQASPDAQQLQDFLKLLENSGVQLALTQEDIVQPQDFQKFSDQLRSLDTAPILFELLADTLQPVEYSLESGPHFGLAYVQNYGQFTAPLNRYGDLLNQRVLSTVFEHGRDRKSARSKEQVDLQSSTCHGQISWNVLPPEHQRELESELAAVLQPLNERIQWVIQAEQDFLGLKKTQKMQQRTGEIYQGIITGIQSYGFFVRLESLLVEGLVHVSSLKDDWYEYRARQQTLIGRKNRQQYRLGDRVEVEIKSVDYYRQQIDLAVVGGGSEASDEDLQNEEPRDERSARRNERNGNHNGDHLDDQDDAQSLGAEATLSRESAVHDWTESFASPYSEDAEDELEDELDAEDELEDEAEFDEED
ncbi:MAG: ribonuclease R [Thermosynechococcaceae cyanobacterium MS004]|nr:ribonuclease R [Thermosynechococcaceae cyanobacterium MS004]